MVISNKALRISFVIITTLSCFHLIRVWHAVGTSELHHEPQFTANFRTVSTTKTKLLDFLHTTDRVARGNRLWDHAASGGDTDVARVVMMVEIERYLRMNELEFNDLLLFNEGDVANPHFEIRSRRTHVHQYHKSSRDGTVVGDVHDLAYMGKSKYDAIYMPQTLEHSWNPFLAVRNLHGILRPGGLLFAVQPFITRPHMRPFHYFGFTPYGLEALFVSEKLFEVVDIFCWGTAEYIELVVIKRKWPKLYMLGAEDLSTVGNQYAQCGIIAKKC